MNGHELRRELEQAGEVWLWVTALEDYVVVMKAALRNTLDAIDDLDDLAVIAHRRTDRVLLIEQIIAGEYAHGEVTP